SRANKIAAARPLPIPGPRDPAPVTMATMPFNRPSGLACGMCALLSLFGCDGRSRRRSIVALMGWSAGHSMESGLAVRYSAADGHLATWVHQLRARSADVT